MRRSPGIDLVLLLCAVAAPVVATAQETTESAGSGEGFAEHTRRIDLRAEVASESGAQEYVLSVRIDHRFRLDDEWQLNLRADFRVVPETNEGHNLERGDTLLHAFIVRRLSDGEGFGFGTQLIVPTAADDDQGRGKWRLRPMLGYRWPVRSITPDSFFQLQFRYDHSFAGDEDEPDRRELQFAPNLEIALPDQAYVSFYPSPEFRYDFEQDELFVPLNVEIGKAWGRWVVSIEGAAGVIKGDHPPYDWRVETRLGRRF